MSELAAVDLFAGPGGWDVAALALGLDPVGVEFDDAACATRAAAGLRTVQADVSALDPAEFAPIDGLIASPPCQAFSMAGKGAGRRAMKAYAIALQDMAVGAGAATDREWLDEECGDPRGHLVLEPLRWALALRPRWVVCEQVEPVLPLWEAMAEALRAHGYHVWAGVLSAEQYGVAQTRRRAFLIASLDGPVDRPPPSHQRYIPPRRREEATLGLFDVPEPERIVAPEDRELLPWVSMAQALGWGMTARPYPVIAGGTGGGPDLEKVGGSGARAQLYDEQASGRWAGVFRPSGGPTKNGNHADGEWLPDRQWIVNTGRDWKEGGSREDAQTFDAQERPAPAVDGKGRWHVEYRRGGDRIDESSAPEHPPTSVTSRADRWQIKPGDEWAGELNADDVAAGRGGQQRSGAGWTDQQPATTLQGDPRIFPPGHFHDDGPSDENAGPNGKAIRVSLAEALVLQSFPPDYPVRGSKTKQFEQVGNAVPPLLALAVLRTVTG